MPSMASKDEVGQRADGQLQQQPLADAGEAGDEEVGQDVVRVLLQFFREDALEGMRHAPRVQDEQHDGDNQEEHRREALLDDDEANPEGLAQKLALAGVGTPPHLNDRSKNSSPSLTTEYVQAVAGLCRSPGPVTPHRGQS